MRQVIKWLVPGVIVVEVVLVLTGVLSVSSGFIGIILIEATLFAIVAVEILVIGYSLFKARHSDGSFRARVEEELSRVVPPIAARALTHDLVLGRAIFLFLRNRKDVGVGSQPITYGRDLLPMLVMMLVIDVGAIVALHFFLPWRSVAVVLLILGVFGAVWLSGFTASFVVYPHSVDSVTLRLRYATLQDFQLPTEAMQSVRLVKRQWDTQRNADVVDDALVLPVNQSTNLRARFDKPIDVVIRKKLYAVSEVFFSADAPDDALSCMRRALPHVTG